MLVLVSGVSLLASEESLAVLVKSERSDDDVGWVNGDVCLLAVGLLFDDFLNVDAPPSAVNFSYLAFTVLVGANHDLDGVSVADGDAAHAIFLS